MDSWHLLGTPVDMGSDVPRGAGVFPKTGWSTVGQAAGDDEAARGAGARLMKREPSKRSFLYVNNRLEGNSLETIRAMMALAGF